MLAAALGASALCVLMVLIAAAALVAWLRARGAGASSSEDNGGSGSADGGGGGGGKKSPRTSRRLSVVKRVSGGLRLALSRLPTAHSKLKLTKTQSGESLWNQNVSHNPSAVPPAPPPVDYATAVQWAQEQEVQTPRSSAAVMVERSVEFARPTIVVAESSTWSSAEGSTSIQRTATSV